MSLSKKRAAPKPPSNPDLPIVQNKENVISAEKENGKDPVKPKILGEKVSLKIVFPDQTTEDILIAPDTQVLDLRTRLCTKYKLSAGEHKLEPLDESGRTIQFTPSSTIASISAKAVHLKPKAKEPMKIAPPKVVEQTVRLTIKMSSTKLQVLRVRPNSPLSQLMPQILDKSGFKEADYNYVELRHPQQTTMALDTTRTLDDYKIREIFVADRRAHIESPEPEPRSTSPVTSPEKGGGKISRGGNVKTSKKIKKFFGLSKKRKTSSETTSPVMSPPIEESKHEEHANSNDNNSTKREETPKKKRPAPVMQVDQQPQNEPLHGQVSEKEESAPQTAEKEQQEAVETKMEEDIEDVTKIPSSPSARPTAQPRQKVPVAAVRAGKKKAPAPPARTSVPPPSKGDQSPADRSRPDKPPRRHSVERQKSPERVLDDEAQEKPESDKGRDESGSEDGAIEIEVPIVKSAPHSPDIKKGEEQIEYHVEDVDGQPKDLEPYEDPTTAQDGKESPPPPPPEEPKEMEVQEDSSSLTQSYQPAPLSQPIVISGATSLSQPTDISPPSLSQSIAIPSPTFESAPEETKHQEEDQSPLGSPDVLVEKDQNLEDVVKQMTTAGFPPPIEPLDTSDISPPPEEEDMKEESEDVQLPPITPDAADEFEFVPAPGEELPPPEVEETMYKDLTPLVENVPVEPKQESLTELPYAPPEVEEIPSQHDIGYEVEAEIAADDLMDVPEPEILPEPEVKAAEPVLDDEDNLFTTPADYNVYETKNKDDLASMEAKALEMLKQFTLTDVQPAHEDPAGGDLPPPPVDILDNFTLPELDQRQEEKAPQEPEEKGEEETKQEIERLKEQINIMRQKKAKKEAEEEAAKKNPYKIVPENNAANNPTTVQGKGTKTFTFVPNPRVKKQYEDYEAAPEVVINLSQSGEIRGMGVAQTERPAEVKVKTPETLSSPEPNTPTSPELEEPPKLQQEIEPLKSPEVIVIEGGAKPSSPLEGPISPIKPASFAPKPIASVPKPKVAGGYVSSAMIRNSPASASVQKPAAVTPVQKPVTAAPVQKPAAASPAQNYTPALYGNGETSKRTSLPNYYRRFLKMEVDTAVEEEDRSPAKQTTSPPKTPVDKQKLEMVLAKKLPPKSLPVQKSPPNPVAVPNGSVAAAKTPPPIAEKPKLAQKVNELLNSPRIETLPAPPEETHPAKSPELPGIDDIPLPPPPEEFFTPPPKAEAPDLSLPLAPNTEYQSSPITSPTKEASPGHATNIVGISAAKPFGSKGAQFRRMSAAFKSGKAGKPNSP